MKGDKTDTSPDLTLLLVTYSSLLFLDDKENLITKKKIIILFRIFLKSFKLYLYG